MASSGAGATGEKYTCAEDGFGDCPCHIAEATRPPATPKELKSLKVTIEPGTAKYFCTCGESKTFPFCDGSHRAYNAANGTSFVPTKVEAAEGEGPKDVWACQCGHSKKRPFCDGSHKKVKAVGAAGAGTA
jgi:CDGSH-type Zn-finger protein